MSSSIISSSDAIGSTDQHTSTTSNLNTGDKYTSKLPQVSNDFSDINTVIDIPNVNDTLFSLHETDFIKWVTGDGTSKQKKHSEIIKMFVDFKKLLLHDIDRWIMSGGLCCDFVSTSNPQPIFSKINDTMAPQRDSITQTFEHPSLWSVINTQVTPTHYLVDNNYATINLDITAAMIWKTVIAPVKRSKFYTPLMNIESLQIAQSMSNVKDFASTQGRNPNDFYNGFNAISTGSTVKSQSVSLIYALLFAIGYGSAAATLVNNTYDPRLRLSDYETQHLIGMFDRTMPSSPPIVFPYNKDAGDTVTIRAQYVSLGWLLSVGQNSASVPQLTPGTPAYLYAQSTDSSGVCVIPFRKSLGVIPAAYIAAHMPWPFIGIRQGFRFDPNRPNDTLFVEGDFMFNACQNLITGPNRMVYRDAINTDVYCNILFVDVNDMNLTFAATYDLQLGSGGYVDINGGFEANWTDIYPQLNFALNNLTANYEAGINYALNIYKDTHSVLMGIKMLLSLLTPRSVQAGSYRQSNVANDPTVLLTSNVASGRIYDYLYSQQLMDGSYCTISANSTVPYVKFRSDPANGELVDSSAMLRCLLASNNLQDPSWSQHSPSFSKFAMGLTLRSNNYLQVLSMSAISAMLFSSSAVMINSLGLSKSAVQPNVYRSTYPLYTKAQNAVWRGLLDINALVTDKDRIIHGQMDQRVEDLENLADCRLMPLVTFGKSALGYVGWKDVKFDSLYTRLMSKNRLPVRYSAGTGINMVDVSNASYGYDLTQNIWIGDEYMYSLRGVKSGNGRVVQVTLGTAAAWMPEHTVGRLYDSKSNVNAGYFEPVKSWFAFTGFDTLPTDYLPAYGLVTDINAVFMMPTVGFSVQSDNNDFPDRDISVIGTSYVNTVYAPYVRNNSKLLLTQPLQYSSFRANIGVEDVDLDF